MLRESGAKHRVEQRERAHSPSSPAAGQRAVAVLAAALLAPLMRAIGGPTSTAYMALVALVTGSSVAAAASLLLATEAGQAPTASLYPTILGAAALLYTLYLILRGGQEPIIETARLIIAKRGLVCSGRRRVAAATLVAAAAAAVAPWSPAHPLAAGAGATAAALAASLYTDSLALQLLAALAAVYEPLTAITLAAAYPSEAARLLSGLTGQGPRVGLIQAVLSRTRLIAWAAALGPAPWTWLLPPETNPLRLPLSLKKPPHVLITGATGSGKSSLAARLARDTMIPLLVLDPHGEYFSNLPEARIVKPSEASLNPLDLAGTQPSRRAAEVAATIASLYRMGPLQQALLEEAILRAYEASGIREDKPETWSQSPPSLEDVLEQLEAMTEDDPRAATVASYVRSLLSTVFRQTRLPASQLLRESHVVDLSELTSLEQRRLYAETLLRILYAEAQRAGETEKPRLMVILEEAGSLAQGSLADLLGRLFAEARKFGIVFVVIAQRASSLPEEVLANTGLRLVLHQPEPRERRYTARMLAPTDDERLIRALEEAVARLRTGEAVAWGAGLASPIIIRGSAKQSQIDSNKAGRAGGGDT